MFSQSNKIELCYLMKMPTNIGSIRLCITFSPVTIETVYAECNTIYNTNIRKYIEHRGADDGTGG
ncbi:MAG: hypothetical protein H6Q72_4862, partial [Firmicutes bacterium]|nr:hypothetical protein [Bacillota bacterium]